MTHIGDVPEAPPALVILDHSGQVCQGRGGLPEAPPAPVILAEGEAAGDEAAASLLFCPAFRRTGGEVAADMLNLTLTSHRRRTMSQR